MIDKQRIITVWGHKAIREQKSFEFITPCSWYLFESVNYFLEFENKGGIALICKAKRLLHEDLFG